VFESSWAGDRVGDHLACRVEDSLKLMKNPQYAILTAIKDELLVIALIGMTTVLLLPLHTHLLMINILMVYLILVFLVALKLHGRASILASFLSIAIYFYFFVPPHSSFEIIELQYLLTLALMLLIAMITTHLASGLRNQVVIAENRERCIRSLYELAEELTGIASPNQIIHPCRRFVSDNFDAHGVLIFPDETGKLSGEANWLNLVNLPWAQRILDENMGTLPDFRTCLMEGSLYIPLQGSEKNQGIMVLTLKQTDGVLSGEQESLLRMSVTFMGLVLERLAYAARERKALLEIDSERLRNALLASLSHDLRTPIAAMAGMADAMQWSFPPLPQTHQTMLGGIRDQIHLILSDVDKLLDMARLHQDIVTLHKEWQVLEEVVGSALKTSGDVLRGYIIDVTMGSDIPLLEMDATMVERVFRNLLENVARHTPVGSRIELAAHVAEQGVVVHVMDNGPGIPQGQEEAIFSKFVHGKTIAGTGGVGLGLSIVRAVVRAHGGSIRAENRKEGGAKFEIIFPLGKPPTVICDTEVNL